MGSTVKLFFLCVLLGLGLVTVIVVASFMHWLEKPYDNEFPKCRESKECHFKVSSSNASGSGRYWYSEQGLLF